MPQMGAHCTPMRGHAYMYSQASMHAALPTVCAGPPSARLSHTGGVGRALPVQQPAETAGEGEGPMQPPRAHACMCAPVHVVGNDRVAQSGPSSHPYAPQNLKGYEAHLGLGHSH